jgi:RNA polymerase sigma-70 factor (ECF subfamily)
MQGRDEALERRLLAQLDAGEQSAAVAGIIRGYGPQILGYLRVVLRNESDAAEVFSAFAEDVLRRIGEFRRASSVRVWAYALAWRAGQRFRRDAFRERARTRPLATSEAARIAEEVVTSLPTRMARRDRVERLREQLDPADQALLVLRFGRGLAWSEIAQALSEEGRPVSEQALRKRFERLRARLQELDDEAQS